MNTESELIIKGIGSSGDETDWGVESENEREEIVWTVGSLTFLSYYVLIA